MPSKSQSQHNLMEAACHDAEFAKKHGIDQKVACEFVEADKKAKAAAEKEGKEPAYMKWKKTK